MNDAGSYQVNETLRNGETVTIRAIRPEDKELILKGVRELDDSTLYLRFFGTKREISDQELKYFTEVDFIDHVALVAVADLDDEPRIIGGGRYIACENPAKIRSAEVAFMIHDRYQGKGLGTIIMKHLLKIARKSGIAQFEAEVLQENSKMLAVFARTGLPLTKVRLGGVLHVTLALSLTESIDGTRDFNKE